MRYKFSPQVCEDLRYKYEIKEGVVEATLYDCATSEDGEEVLSNPRADTFDFTAFPDGVSGEVITGLPSSPIISAKKADSILSLELVSYISPHAGEDERFPEWVVI